MSAAALSPSLVERCVSGEQSAWRELHRAYHPQVVTFLRRLGVRPNEADDAAQEVFLQVFRYLAGFEARAGFKTWLYKLCISEASRRHRKPSRVFLGAAQVEPTDPGGEPASEQLVRRALASLNEKERASFVLYELEGLPGDEIARIMDCPVNTVWRRLHHARERFRAYVQDPPIREALR